MNSSQFILLFAAFIILSSSILIVNKSAVETEDERINAKIHIKAVTEARNLFEEIKTKIFDEKIISLNSLNKDSLTLPFHFGPDGEVYPHFDDIDDYHNYTREIIMENNSAWKLKVIVNYVNDNNPDQFSTSPTYYKLVRLFCLDENQFQVFELKQIFSVW